MKCIKAWYGSPLLVPLPEHDTPQIQYLMWSTAARSYFDFPVSLVLNFLPAIKAALPQRQK